MTDDLSLEDLDEAPGYDPANPLGLLEKAAAAEPNRRAMAAVQAIRTMAAVGADAGVMTVARDYVKRARLIAAADFDRLVRESQAADRAASEPDAKSASTDARRAGAGALHLRRQRHRRVRSRSPPTGRRSWPCCAAARRRCAPCWRASTSPSRGRAADPAGASGRAPGRRGHRPGQPRVSRCTCAPRSTRARSGSTSATPPAAPSASPRADGRSRTAAPVLFKRTALTGPLPEPERGGNIGELWALAERRRG